jgi:hypothetical protein
LKRLACVATDLSHQDAVRAHGQSNGIGIGPIAEGAERALQLLRTGTDDLLLKDSELSRAGHELNG